MCRCIRKAPELIRREFEREGVKLHATVINCKFLSRGSDDMELESHKGKKLMKPKQTIDATGIFKVRPWTSMFVCLFFPSFF